MPRILQAFFVLGMWVVAIPAAAQEPTDEPTAEEPKPTAKDQQSAEAGTGPAAPPPTPEVKPVEEKPEGWHTFVSGYFRAPVILGISPRPGPDNPTGPAKTQVSYGPNRIFDWNYYSFAYTRLQEQDWAEVSIHAKKKHVEAVVGWMGYWFQAAGYRYGDAAWIPGVAYLTLDTDLGNAGFKPNLALTAGAWWPSFGYFEKYDTYTLGRFRQIGEQLKFALPLSSDLTLALVQGFGTSRDGSYNFTVATANPLYAGTTGLDLLHYENVRLTYGKYVDIGLHFNNMWTRDPTLTPQNALGDKSYQAAAAAHLTTVGGEVNLSAPYAGRVWISPSYIHVRNGWALANAGTEVMHSLGGAGIASNYMAWSNSPPDSTGSGSMLNLGFLYENTLSRVLGKTPGSQMPEVTLSVFGLLANAKLSLPPGSTIVQHLNQNKIKQFKYGADVTLQALNWLGFMARWDEVNYDLDHPGYVFSAITGRAIFSTHFLSSESIYLQYSRYRYGDRAVLYGRWPWGAPLVAGTDVLQSKGYPGQKPDMDVIKIQASVAF